MSYLEPILVSDGPTDPEYEEEIFSDFESPGASPIAGPEEDYSLNPYEEESYNEEEENPTQRKLHKILLIIDKLRELFVEILDEI